MRNQSFISYYRVSTKKQSDSGLGLDAQKQTVNHYLQSVGGEVLDSFVETESGKKSDRPKLQKAIKNCQLKNAILLVAKLDRLSRDLHFVTSLQKSGIRFVVAENPEMNELTVHILAAMAQHETNMISDRTKKALAAAKARGVKLGNPRLSEAGGGDTTNARKAKKEKSDKYATDMSEVIGEIKESGVAGLMGIAQSLNSMGFTTSRGFKWTPCSVSRVVKRCSAI